MQHGTLVVLSLPCTQSLTPRRVFPPCGSAVASLSGAEQQRALQNFTAVRDTFLIKHGGTVGVRGGPQRHMGKATPTGCMNSGIHASCQCRRWLRLQDQKLCKLPVCCNLPHMDFVPACNGVSIRLTVLYDAPCCVPCYVTWAAVRTICLVLLALC